MAYHQTITILPLITFVYTHLSLYIYIIYIIYIYIYIHTYIHIHTYITLHYLTLPYHPCMHTYIHAYIHTYIHTSNHNNDSNDNNSIKIPIEIQYFPIEIHSSLTELFPWKWSNTKEPSRPWAFAHPRSRRLLCCSWGEVTWTSATMGHHGTVLSHPSHP